MKKTASEIKRGQAITFRIPSDTPDHLLRQLQKLKETERRNFSSRIAEFVLEGAGNATNQDREMIQIPLPNKLSKAQRDWLKHAHSEAMLGSILFHLLSDPIRATSLLASLNSSALEIDEALYLQEEGPAPAEELRPSEPKMVTDEDLDDFDWGEKLSGGQGQEQEAASQEESLDDLLGDFLAQMKKEKNGRLLAQHGRFSNNLIRQAARKIS